MRTMYYFTTCIAITLILIYFSRGCTALPIQVVYYHSSYILEIPSGEEITDTMIIVIVIVIVNSSKIVIVIANTINSNS